MRKINLKNVAIIFSISLMSFIIGSILTLYKVNEALEYRGIIIKIKLSLDQVFSIIQN